MEEIDVTEADAFNYDLLALTNEKIAVKRGMIFLNNIEELLLEKYKEEKKKRNQENEEGSAFLQ